MFLVFDIFVFNYKYKILLFKVLKICVDKSNNWQICGRANEILPFFASSSVVKLTEP